MPLTDVFDRYDFLTTLVPGGAFLFVVSVLFASDSVFSIELSPEVLLVIGVAVFLVGEVITMFTDMADPGQRLFGFMLLAAEVRLELEELDESVERLSSKRLGDEQRTDETLQEVLSRLTGYRAGEITSWSPDRQRSWAWAHVLSLILSEGVLYRHREDGVFSLTRDGNTDPERWVQVLRPALGEGREAARELEELREWKDSTADSTPTYASDFVNDHRDPANYWYEEENWFARRYRRYQRTMTGRAAAIHEWQLTEWLTEKLENDQRDILDVWFDDELWDELSDRAWLWELGELADSIQSLYTRHEVFRGERRYDFFFVVFLEEAGKTLASLIPGFTWFSRRFSHEEPVPWIDRQTVRHLREQFRLPPLRDRYEPPDDAPSQDVVQALHRQWYADVFRALFTMVEDDVSSQADRFRSRAVFHHNMWVTVGFIFLLFALVTLLRVGGGLLGILGSVLAMLSGWVRNLGNVLDTLAAALDGLFAPVFGVLDALFAPLTQLTGLDWLVVVGGFVLLVYAIIFYLLPYLSREDSPVSGLNRKYISYVEFIESIQYNASFVVATFGLVVLVLWGGFVVLHSYSRALALLLVVLAGLHIFGVGRSFLRFPRRFSWSELEYYVEPSSLSGVIWLFAAAVLFIAILSGAGANIPVGGDVNRLLATIDRQVLEFGWLVAGTLFAFGLWPMFAVWKRKHEYEYLRYLIATYYTVTLHSEDAAAPSEADVSQPDGDQ